MRSGRGGLALPRVVIRGLDPRIHPSSQEHFPKGMDCRVKPGNDGAVVGTAASPFGLRPAYTPSTVITMSFSSVDALRSAISG
jgi:hypothetical protein